MISIGATAGGNETSIKNGDATAFSKWNEGLVDRFCQKILDPSENYSTVALIEELKKYKPTLDIHSKYRQTIAVIYYNSKTPNDVDVPWDLIDPLIIKYKIDNPELSTLKSPAEKAAHYIVNTENKTSTDYVVSDSFFSTDSSTSYIKWIIDAIGGSSAQRISSGNNSINYESPDKIKYWLYDSGFIEQGKSNHYFIIYYL